MNHRKFSQQTEIIYYNQSQQQTNQISNHKRSSHITHKSSLMNSDSKNHMEVIEYMNPSKQTYTKNRRKSQIKKDRKQSTTTININNNNKRSSRVTRNNQKIKKIFKKKQIKRNKNELLRMYFMDIDDEYMMRWDDLKTQFGWMFSRYGQYPNNYRDFNCERQQSVIPLRQRTRSVNIGVEQKKVIDYEDLFKNQKRNEQNIQDMKQSIVKRQRAQSIQISRVRRLSSDMSQQVIEKTNKLQAYDNLNIIRLQIKEKFRQLDEEQKQKESNIQMQQLIKRHDDSVYYHNIPLIQISQEGKKYNQTAIFMYFIRNVSNMGVNQKCWFYKDMQNSIQGPFNSIEMDNWNMMKYFQSSLQISWIQTNTFVSLANFIQFPNIIINGLQQYYDLTNILQKKLLRRLNMKKDDNGEMEQMISTKTIRKSIHSLVQDSQDQSMNLDHQIIDQDLNEIKRQLGIIVELK